MTRQESFSALIYRHVEDSLRIKMLAKTSQDLWPPREARRLARQYREIAEALEKMAEREVV